MEFDFDIEPNRSLLPKLSTETIEPRSTDSLDGTDVTSAELLNDIIKNGEIIPHFQPIIDLFTGEIFGYEVLSRSINHFHDPAPMFAAAFKHGKTAELENACRKAAFQKISTLSGSCRKKLFFINVSPHIFGSPEFNYNFTRSELTKLDIDYRSVVIEITESATVSDYTHFEEQIRHYVSEGFQVALDDFGAGHSGLITLVAMTPHFLKLDRAIINNIHIHAYKQKLVKAISGFSTNVETSLIAEGIEQYEELKTAFRLGVRYAQGFLFSKPQPNPPELTREQEKLLHTLIDEYNHTRFAVDISIAKLVTRPPTIECRSKTCAMMDKEFKCNNSMDHVVIVDRERPVGLITRKGFYSATGGRYGYAFFERKYVEQLMLPNMLIVEERTDLRILAKLAMSRQQEELYNPVVIVDKAGILVGTITIKQLLAKAFDTEIKLASFANPLTQLPGNIIIDVWLEQALRNKQYTVVYCDLSYFKEFNDKFGFAKGDDIIKLTAAVIHRNISDSDPDIRFGHIGGDDFILISKNEISETVLERICSDFDREKESYFEYAQVQRGFYRAINRQGEETDIPLVSLSLAVVTQDNFEITPHPGKLSEITANLKTKIKLLNTGKPRSNYLIERRTYEV